MQCLLNAQLDDAVSLYNDLGYKTSTIVFEDHYQKNTDEEFVFEDILKIANSYRLIHDTEQAEKWYALVVTKSDNPINFLYYAQALQSNGSTDQAKEYFLKYDQLSGLSDKRGIRLANAIDRMNELPVNDVSLTYATSLNSDKLEFSPTYYEKGIVFVSTKESKGNRSKKDLWIDDNFMSLFYAAENEEGGLDAPEEFSYHLNTPYHEGPVDFNTAGDQIFFTRNNFNKGKLRKSTKGNILLKIYTAKKEGEDWGESVELPFNTEDFEECHPALFPDGRTLIFSSNRTGGFGGMDLYSSRLEGDTWGVPVNLGPEINTAGNELFPFVHEDGSLYFASNGWGGLGGLDIFSSTFNLADDSWLVPANIGMPFNSNKDDFGFILNVLNSEGYLSSAREGDDNIYSFKVPPGSIKKPSSLNIISTICAYEAMDQSPINEVQFLIQGTNKLTGEKTSKISSTNEQGNFEMSMMADYDYVLQASKDGYIQSSKTFSTEGMYSTKELSICLPMQSDNCLSLNGIVKAKENNQILPNATVELINNCTGKKEILSSNAQGAFSLDCLDPNCTYTSIASKDLYQKTTGNVTINKDELASVKSVNLIINMSRVPSQPIVTQTPSYTQTPTYSQTPSQATTQSRYPQSNPSKLESSIRQNYNVGSVIEMEKIYYNYDDYHIRDDAKTILNELVEVMNKYPSLKIRLTAHTDSRGHWKYNSTLSKNRAKYAVNYLISKGISKNRLSHRGLGESQLRNECDEGIKCTEEQHQYNRRTMITITAFDRKDIDVKYLNNNPVVIK